MTKHLLLTLVIFTIIGVCALNYLSKRIDIQQLESDKVQELIDNEIVRNYIISKAGIVIKI
jgi:hypothetical protein